MSDLISRQAAIDALGEQPYGDDDYDLGCRNQWEWDVKAIENLPPAQPEPKMGKWLDANICGELPVIVCDQCNTFYPLSFGEFHNFCPNCGAKMEGDAE